MVYDALEYDDLVTILDSMRKDGMVTIDKETYTLSLKGLFEVKKRTIVPLLKLTDNPEYVKAFIEKNKETCDSIFLNELVGMKSEFSKEAKIVEFAKNNYHKIAPIIAAIFNGVSQ